MQRPPSYGPSSTQREARRNSTGAGMPFVASTLSQKGNHLQNRRASQPAGVSAERWALGARGHMEGFGMKKFASAASLALATAFAAPVLAADYKMSTPIAPGVATPDSSRPPSGRSISTTACPFRK